MAIVYAGSILTVYNLRPYARGDLPGSLIAAARRNFNSRPCTRGDGFARPRPAPGMISIHAPARGATPLPAAHGGCENFNSRPCTRGDRCRDERAEPRAISIHAPARGATRTNGSVLHNSIYFNSRPCTRGDAFLAISSARARFQFTPLHEGRPRKLCEISTMCYFNSRPCTRGDGKRYAFSANLLFNPHKSTHSNSGVMYFAGIVFGNISQNHCMNFSITLRELSS